MDFLSLSMQMPGEYLHQATADYFYVFPFYHLTINYSHSLDSDSGMNMVQKAAQHTTGKNTTHNPNTFGYREDFYINNISNNRRQQFPRPKMLIPDDNYIGRNI
jgi:hypothetical protein